MPALRARRLSLAGMLSPNAVILKSVKKTFERSIAVKVNKKMNLLFYNQQKNGTFAENNNISSGQGAIPYWR